ncbi:flagellar basal body-associated FliL family protein [Shimia thalassica]|uniref:flagellar basal body-associated FliL family protein n=1 Tax=Shimia thalassica TaxID=1715693 RepID=UPI0026E27AE2|nr:flagellar basal body-associated FliL family protein [Shimia thalassica]MDO6522999.1 flagellar basal body-associated FliL family protein [Shimia thalassica]
MKKVLPILLALFGIGLGAGTGFYLKQGNAEKPEAPSEECVAFEHGDPTNLPKGEEVEDSASTTDREYAKLNNQFVIPIVQEEAVESLVLISLSIEVVSGNKDLVFEREPKLRDALLQVMFDHANMGGFKGTFTNSSNLKVLRTALLETAQKTLGDVVSDVLILDLARQEI